MHILKEIRKKKKEFVYSYTSINIYVQGVRSL
jgi:hypothetical protein